MTSTDLPAIDPKRTALLVMDVQNGIVGSIADPGPYRFRTRRIGSELRFGVVSRARARSRFGVLWVPEILSLWLTRCFLVEQGRVSSGSGCVMAMRHGALSTRVTTIRLPGGAPDIRLAGLACPLRSRQRR
jgi:hypothetical protein